MSESLPFLDLMLLVVLPYAAVAIAAIGTLERYRSHAFSCSSHSSQILERRLHFWGEMAFHYGILTVLLGHVLVVAAPGAAIAWMSAPARLFVTEALALACGLLALGGLGLLIVRRAVTPSLRMTTGALDWVVLTLLFVQIAGGVAVAIIHPWGGSWFASTLTPYLRSLVFFEPNAGVIAAMPLLVKAHVVAAYALVGIFPFTRLVHVVAVPNRYLWRRPQVVRWRAGRSVA
jgi:nitrate reductase gamma subunit